jgi:hypothetical protein
VERHDIASTPARARSGGFSGVSRGPENSASMSGTITIVSVTISSPIFSVGTTAFGFSAV